MLLEENRLPPFKVLVLCTGNSARSILAEALFNKAGNGMFEAYSAGSHPTGKVNPFAIELLEKQGFDCSGYHSKSWDDFAQEGAPNLDFVVTVCGNAAAEQCPAFQGNFKQIHWGFPDPAEYTNMPEKAREAFGEVYNTLKLRIESLVKPVGTSLDKASVTKAMESLAS
jgi:arsenate reductase